MNTVFDVTTQRQNGDKADNVALPVTEERTGIWLNAGVDDSIRTFGNTISNIYAEACRRPVFLEDQSTVLISKGFSQGGSVGDKSLTPIQLDRSEALVEVWTGQDFYDENNILVNGSVLRGEIRGVATSSKSIDATSIQYAKTNQESFKFHFSYTSTTATSKLLPPVMEDKSHYQLRIAGLFNGVSIISAAFHIYRHTSDALTKITPMGAVSGSFTVSASGGQISIDTSTTTQIDYEIFFEEKTPSITDKVVI